MSEAPEHPRDPIAWHAALATAFLVLCLVRLAVPSKPFFDEVHYLPAARAWLELTGPTNIEHPPLGKQLLALGMTLFGDEPFGWRILPALFGTLGLFAFMRALWFAAQSRFASLAGGFLVATGFMWFVQSRIAMLDIFMAAFVMLALWALAAAVREPETARRRFAIAGVCLGLAMAAKWNAVPLAMLPGLAFVAIRAREAGWRVVTAHRGAPVAGMTTWEAALWLGLVPLLAYALTYLPGVGFGQGAWSANPFADNGVIGIHGQMLALQQQPLPSHTYQSSWPQWIGNWRAIWYLYEQVDGAQRGVLLIGNPLTALLGIAALVWAGWMGLFRGRADALALVLLYLAALGLWVVAAKPVQFFYHYLLPGAFTMGMLALGLDELWRRGNRWLPLATLTGAAGFFAYFFPILSAAPLADTMSFLDYAWLESWR